MEADSQSTRPFGVRYPKERKERSSFPHLRPLSSYSRKIMCDKADGCASFGQNQPTPFCNIKIEIINNQAPVSAKRRLDDSCLEESYSTPLRKRLALSSSTPAVGGAPELRGNPLSKIQAPKSLVKPQKPHRLTMIRKADRGATLGRPATRPQPGPVTTGGVVSGAPSGSECPSPDSASRRGGKTPSEMDVDHAFDFDIEEILSLSPIYSGSSDDSESIEAFIESCQSFYENSHAQDPAGHAQPAADPGAERGGEVGGVSGKEAISLDEGYFSRSYREALRRGSGGVGQHPEVGPLQSSPLVPGAEPPPSNREQVAVVGGASPSPAPPDEPVVCRNLLSYLDGAALPVTSRALQGAEGAGLREEAGFSEASVQRGSLSGGNRELRGQGVTVKVELAVERSYLSPCKVTAGSFGDEGDLTKKSFNDTTLSPVQARRNASWRANEKLMGIHCSFHTDAHHSRTFDQVRSVVVVPQKRAEPGDARTQLGHKYTKRPVVYDREADWEREKEQYVATVTSHMADSAPSGGGAMTELVNLMRTVARQGTSTDTAWQHPADFTRRNYQGPSGKARISLDKWLQQNTKTYCRFANVPPKFHRSPVP
ncbi:hypothetical protein SKAU_G00420160 [Synaphobranchus kaupii]|uniref:S100P-binding protein n=1 Tax=Synaphobranchus kaupii TaxID=118154 RepID=A0A9Q1IA98_SYNKA|nr:hypothetical protein SKAU_G00420160 [Synaphobranchus kaupii]